MTSRARVWVVAAWAALILVSVVVATIIGVGAHGTASAPRWSTTIGLGVLIVVMTTLAGTLLLRTPGHRIGVVFAALALVMALANFSEIYLRVSYLGGGEPLPGALVVGLLGLWVPGVLWMLIALVLLLFPTGSLPSRRWRPVAGAAVVVYGLMILLGMFSSSRIYDGGPINPLASAAFEDFTGVVDLWLASTLVTVAAAGSLVARYRSAGGVERRQLKWLTLSGILIIFGGLVMVVAAALGGESEDLTTVAGLLFGGGLASIPVFATLAILRYRLYEIDRIVSRTLSYAVLTVVLATLYAVAVFGLSAGVASVGGGSEIAVAGATLAVAAAFQPARHRVQQLVNRRFNRSRYDAERTVAGFADRLRDRVDVDDVKGDLLHTAVGVVQPVRAQVWLRPDA